MNAKHPPRPEPRQPQREPVGVRELGLVVAGAALEARVARGDRQELLRPAPDGHDLEVHLAQGGRHVDLDVLDRPDRVRREERLRAADHRACSSSRTRSAGAGRALSASRTSSHASRPDVVNGFSQRTFAPASSAAFASAWWAFGVEPTMTASTPVAERLVDVARSRGRTGSGRPRCGVVPASVSTAATHSTSSRPSMAGRWFTAVQEPTPRTARLALAIASALRLAGWPGDDAARIPVQHLRVVHGDEVVRALGGPSRRSPSPGRSSRRRRGSGCSRRSRSRRRRRTRRRSRRSSRSPPPASPCGGRRPTRCACPARHRPRRRS